MLNKFNKLSTGTLLCVCALPIFAAKPIGLTHQKLSYLKSIISANTALKRDGTSLKELSQTTDFNQTRHIRLKQMYIGHPVWGGDAIVHTPNGSNKKFRSLLTSPEAAKSTINGLIYAGLQQDLQNTPAYVFNSTQADKAFTQAITYFEYKTGARADVKNKSIELIVYVDEKNKAHWVFKVSVSVNSNGKLAQPIYLLDALDFHIYKTWNNRQTSALDTVHGGGLGGNIRQKYVYDGGKDHLTGFDVQHDAKNNLCYLTNDLITVTDARTEQVAQFECSKPDNEHNNVFWSGNIDEVNGGYSPNNDAMYAAQIINDMYQTWYQIPVLAQNGKPMRLDMVTHDPEEGENASWDDIEKKMHFGDGGDEFYPLTSIGVAAHEISHGFTSQHSNLIYDGESGGMNEAFSDMADQAVLFYSMGKADYMIGSGLAKQDNFVLRYMDEPSKDCPFLKEEIGQCSIDTAKEYNPDLDVHFSSGVYNRAFYLLSTSEGWNVKKAFDLMVQANRFYWTSNSTFFEGACGVLKAAKDYKYDTKTVVNVFKDVGIETDLCYL